MDFKFLTRCLNSVWHCNLVISRFLHTLRPIVFFSHHHFILNPIYCVFKSVLSPYLTYFMQESTFSHTIRPESNCMSHCTVYLLSLACQRDRYTTVNNISHLISREGRQTSAECCGTTSCCGYALPPDSRWESHQHGLYFFRLENEIWG